MKYIVDDENCVTQYDAYFEYIASISNLIPPELSGFFGDISRYELKSTKTLHDSWMRELNIKVAEFDQHTNRSENSISTTVEIVLFNRYTDYEHTFLYRDTQTIDLQNINTGTGRRPDLLAHEFRVEDQYYVHEYEFENNASIVIVCKDIAHSEQSCENSE